MSATDKADYPAIVKTAAKERATLEVAFALDDGTCQIWQTRPERVTAEGFWTPGAFFIAFAKISRIGA